MGSEIVVSPKKEEMKLSLGDIEEAYLILMKAYSSCLAALIGEKRKIWHFMVPPIIRWRTKKRVDMLRVTFQLLIASEKKDGTESKNIKKFEAYCKDLNGLSEQIVKSGYMNLLFGSTFPILTLLFSLFKYVIETEFNKSITYYTDLFSFGLSLMLFFLSLEIIIIILLIIPNFVESSRVFNRFGVREKDEHFYKLVQNYSG